MADISVPGLATQTPLAADSIPGVRASTGLLDCRYTLSALRTFANASLAAVASTGAYTDLSGKPTLGTVAALSYPGGTTGFLRADGSFAIPPGVAVNWGSIGGTLSSQTDLNTALGLKAATSSLATVATSGAYADLSGKPSLGTVAALNYSGATSFLRGDGTFAQVAYALVTGTPTLGTVSSLSTNASTTQYLRGDGTWVVPPGTGLTNPMTTAEDIIKGGASGTPARLAVGANGTFLGVTAGVVGWSTPSGSGDVVGPAGAVSGKVATFSGTTGKLIADSGVTLGTLASQNGTFSGTSSGTNTGDQSTVSGNAGSATVLATARNINGVSFNGSANITVPVSVAEQTVASSATVTPTFANDIVTITAQAAALALANPTGTAVQGWGIVIRIKDNGTARAITYGTQYRAIGVTLPATTVISKTLYLGMIFNNTDTKWDVVSVAQEA